MSLISRSNVYGVRNVRVITTRMAHVKYLTVACHIRCPNNDPTPDDGGNEPAQPGLNQRSMPITKGCATAHAVHVHISACTNM